MTNNPPKKPPFSMKQYMEKVAYAAQQRPEISHRIYATAAEKIRFESRSVSGPARHEMHRIAAHLDSLAAQATVAPMNFATGDIPQTPTSVTPHHADDIQELVSQMVAARHDENGHPVDDLVASARLAQMQQDAEKSDAPAVSTVPQSSLKALTGSTALCQYGGSVTNAASGNSNLSPVSGTTAYQETTVVRWDGDPGEMQTVTIDGWIQTSGGGGTYPAGTNAAGTFYSYRPFMHAFFGSSRGAPAEVYVDIGRGAQFSVATNFLVVNVGMDQPCPANPTEVAGSMVLGASMGFRQTNHQSPLLRTVYINNQAGGGGIVSYLIPLFASRLEAFITTTPANWTLSMRTLGSNTLATITGSQLASNAVALPGNAWSIAVANNGGAPDSASLVFSLLL